MPPDGLSVIYDLVVKRHEFFDRAFDALNTRAGAVFAFSNFVLPVFVTAFDRMLVGHWGLKLVIALFVLPLHVLMIVSCKAAYQVANTAVYPDLRTLYVENSSADEAAARKMVFSELDAAYTENKTALALKAEHLRHALNCFEGEIAFMVIVLAFAYLRSAICESGWCHDGGIR